MGTRMELLRPLSTGEGGSYSLTFSELSGIVTVPANGTVYLPLDAGSHRYEVKTIYAKQNKQVNIKVELKDRDTNGFSYYSTGERLIVNDIAGVPAADKTGNKKVHAFITNAGNEPIDVEIVIKIIPMSGGN